MIKRIIFDLDNTLIPWDSEWDLAILRTFDYYNIPYEEDIIDRFLSAFYNYEKHHIRFDKVRASRYIAYELGIDLPDTFVEVWTSDLANLVPNRDEKLIELLEYLSSKYSLVIASNSFYSQQIGKLKKLDLLKYFDQVLTADTYNKKPYKEMYEVACEGYDKSEVVMVGDTFKTDIKSAMDFGIYSYYLTTTDPRKGKKFKRISNIYELKEYL